MQSTLPKTMRSVSKETRRSLYRFICSATFHSPLLETGLRCFCLEMWSC